MVEFAIEGYFGQAARFLSIQRLSVRVVSGDLSVYPLYDPLSFYLNELIPYIHKLLGCITIE
jgi:hypothetical protein